MKKQAAFCVDVKKKQYRRQIEDRLKNRPTFDPVTGNMVWQMVLFEQR